MVSGQSAELHSHLLVPYCQAWIALITTLFSFDEKSCEIAINYVPLRYLQPVFLAI